MPLRTNRLEVTLLLQASPLLVEATSWARCQTTDLQWGFPKIRGPFLGVLVIGVMIYWGVLWGPLFKATNMSVPAETRCHNTSVFAPTV